MADKIKPVKFSNLSTFAAEMKKRYALKAELPTKVSELTNDAKFQTEEQVAAAINAKVSSTYKAGGSVAFADLPELSEANLGLVVNVTDKFTATADFVEGAGGKHPAGTNVAVVQAGEDIKYDVLAGFVDLSGYVTKEEATTVEASETNGNLKVNGEELTVYTLPDTVLHQTDIEEITEAEIIALFDE